MTDIRFGDRLRERLDALEMTQVELSLQTGLTQKTLSNYVNSMYLPGLENAILLAKTLGCSLDWLCDIGAEPEAYSEQLELCGQIINTSERLMKKIIERQV